MQVRLILFQIFLQLNLIFKNYPMFIFATKLISS